MVLPNCGPLPQTSHTRAITLDPSRLIPVRLPKPQFYRNSDFARAEKEKEPVIDPAGSLVALADAKTMRTRRPSPLPAARVRTAAGVDGNLTQAFRALLGVGSAGAGSCASGNERIHRVTTKK